MFLRRNWVRWEIFCQQNFYLLSEKKISPEIEGLVEKSGYVTKSKYDSLERLAQQLEKRIIDLEKNL